MSIVYTASKSTPCPICGGDNCTATHFGMYFCWRTFESVPGFHCIGISESGCGKFWPDDVDAPLPHEHNGHEHNGHEHNGAAYSRNGHVGHVGRKKKPATDFAKYLSENGCNARER